MSDLQTMISDAVKARKGSLSELRERIATLLADIPIGVKLCDDAGEVLSVRRIRTGASQWANMTWDVTIKGRGYLAAGKLVSVDCEDSYWDGNNMHHRSTEPYILGTDPDLEDAALSWLSGKATRDIAARLPEAITRYIQECKAEATANEATLR